MSKKAMAKILAEDFLDSLGITERAEDYVPSLRVQNELQTFHALNLDSSDEHFIDALFSSEETAVEVLAGNRERLVSSIQHTARFLRRFNREEIRVLDFGGGTGLMSLCCAINFPSMNFCVCDTSIKCLQIGKAWCEKLSLSNVTFIEDAFSRRETEYDAIFAEYVFSLRPKEDCKLTALRKLLAFALPKFRTSLKMTGRCQVRFGEYNKVGLAILMEEVWRTGWFCDRSNTWGGKRGATMTLLPASTESHLLARISAADLFKTLRRHTRDYTKE